MKRSAPFTVIAVVLFAGLLVFSGGCKKKEGSAAKKPKIAGIVFQEDQFFRLVQFGMKEAAEKGGAELFQANSANKPDKESQLVRTYTARKVDAIVISPLSKKASIKTLKEASDKAITIITYNTNIDGDVPSAYIESDQKDLGVQTGGAVRKYIQRHLGGEAKIAVLAFKSLAPEQSAARVAGFKSRIADMVGVEIVAEQDAWLPEAAIKKAGDIITANPGVDIIWAANEGGTIGAVMAVKNAGKSGSVVVFGTDTSEQLTDFLLSEDNILQAITGQRPFEIGFEAVQSALKVLRAEKVEPVVSMPGVFLAREDPNGVRAFQKRLRDLISGGSK